MKTAGEKISMLTAYDFSFARIIDNAGIDIILVGDSASNVMAGNETTLPITLDNMIYHAQSVIKGVDRCLVVVDMLLNAEGQVLEAEVAAESPAGFGFGLAALDTAKTFEFYNTFRRRVLLTWQFEFVP